MAETHFQIATRKTIDKNIREAYLANDMDQVNAQLEIYPYGRERKPLGVVAMYQTLKHKGAKAARFFEKQAIAEAGHPTEEMEVVVG